MMISIGKMAIVRASALIAGAILPIGAIAQTDLASAAEIRGQVAAMLADMKPGQGFAWRPLLRDGQRVVAIEIWKKPGRPAVHPAEAEYAVVLEGAGMLVSGGTLVGPVKRGEELVEGDRIEGGTTRPLHAGDVLLLPAGVPHEFGITGDRLVLVGTKLSVK
ncbi:cupin domain-containing protein [Sphingomonas sp. CFBP8993]|uniref:cupin domain-containing protein n=1 Tax=Sphingomonas sp. CFBP8993 TaxID=3096526 RepID=UPI002A6A66F4|nr:cupin domain-containing protein [Sphingomonas sp. CFBP8993]MDY0957247.1 cupin domain-containing protein [Sphingomonas sp. CFBP8993]